MTDPKQWTGLQEGPSTESSTVVQSPVDDAVSSRPWTPERIRGAKPLPHRTPSVPPTAATQEPDVGHWPETFVPPYIGTRPYDAMCKIYFEHNQTDYVASGWIVVGNTGLKGIVTAGHVVYDEGRWSKNYLILRQYSDGNSAEAFTGRFARTLNGWIKRNGIPEFWDIGAIIPDAPIPENTPALPVAYGYVPTHEPYNFLTDAGYPADPANGYPFNGELLWVTNGPLKSVFQQGNERVLEAFNAMSGGSSGSPWLTYFKGSRDYVAIGLQSTILPGEPLAYSPYFEERNIAALLRDIGVLA